MSYIVKVKVIGEEELVGNALVFATKKEAREQAQDQQSRWSLVQYFVVEESTAPATYTYMNGILERIKEVPND